MTKSSLQQDQYKIPAFQRKRSLAAKARRKNKPRTALERLQAGVPFVKPKRKRVTKTGRSVVRDGVTETTLNYGRMRRASSEVREREALDDYFGSRMSSSRERDGYDEPRESSFSSPLVEESGYERSGYERPSYEAPSYEYGSVNDSLTSATLPSFREMRECGQLDGYFDKIQVAGIKVSSRVAVGDRLVFETADGLFEQEITSMQIDRKDVQVAYAGDEIGVKVLAKPSNNGRVFKVV